MIDQVAELFFLPIISRRSVAVLDKVNGGDMTDQIVRIRIEKRERLIRVGVQVLSSISEIGLHAAAVIE